MQSIYNHIITFDVSFTNSPQKGEFVRAFPFQALLQRNILVCIRYSVLCFSVNALPDDGGREVPEVKLDVPEVFAKRSVIL